MHVLPVIYSLAAWKTGYSTTEQTVATKLGMANHLPRLLELVWCCGITAAGRPCLPSHPEDLRMIIDVCGRLATSVHSES